MHNISKPLLIAVVGLGLSAFFHVIAPFIYGWGMPMALFIPIALLYGCFILGLLRGIAWLPYLVLACMVIGGVGSLYEMYRVSPIADLLLAFIAIADFSAAIALMVHLKAKRV